MLYDLCTPAPAPAFSYDVATARTEAEHRAFLARAQEQAAAAQAALEALTTATPAERTEALRALQALASGEPCTHDFFEGYTPADAIATLEALED